MPRFVLVLDTPGIKEFVFGTDALAEIRGGSALLDRLNRHDTEQRLRSSFTGGSFRKVYANGGAAQFIVEANNLQEIRNSIDNLNAYYREQTGGEVRVLAGIAELAGDESYQQAIRKAYHEMRLQRNLASSRPTVPTFPIVLECDSASHLPAAGPYPWGGDKLILSEASAKKRDEVRRTRDDRSGGSLWEGWMEYLDQHGTTDQSPFTERAGHLRPRDAEAVGEKSKARKGYVGLIYADGNAMGRLVQQLDSPEVYSAFSEKIVDRAIRQACYQSLSDLFRSEIDELAKGASGRIPADILLLGGDDLLVLVPADRALAFAIDVTRRFTELTKRFIAENVGGGTELHKVYEFFSQRGLADRGMTISCGVAIGPGRYPFYLLLDLAENLLKSAKRGGSDDPDCSEHGFWSPAYIDFHSVTGAVTSELSVEREQSYLIKTDHPRTLRPFRREALETTCEAARLLRREGIPNSKLHALHEAALEPRWRHAERRARELFARLVEKRDRHERRALWQALNMIGKLDPFPWMRSNDLHRTALADLIEVHDYLGG